MEIKAYLSYRDRLGMPGQFAQDIRISVRRRLRIVRVDADGMVQTFIHPGKRLKTFTGRDIGGRVYYMGYAA